LKFDLEAMLKKITLLIFLYTYHLGFSQSEAISVAEIKKNITEAGVHLSKLECDKSLVFAKKALEKALVINDNQLIARSYNLIGLNLDEYYDFAKAIFFFNKGLEYANKTNSDFIKYSLHNNIARTYSFRNIDFKKGIYHYKQGLYYSKLLKDNYEIMYANLNIATAYFAIDDYKNGFPYLKVVKESVESSDELEAKISYNSLLGAYYSYKNKYADSEKSYTKALEFCGENKSEFLEGNAVEVYDDIARMYSKKGDFEKAYLYMDKYNVLKEKLYNEHSKVERNTGTSLFLDDYKRQINQLEILKARQLKIIRHNKVIVILSIILLFICIIVLVTLYKRIIFKRKVNLKLTETNKEIEEAKQLAEELLALKSQFVSTMSHELKTPLYGVLGIVDVLEDVHPELAKSTYIDSLKFSANYLLSIVNDVLSISKFENSKISLDKAAFNIFDEMNSILGTLNVLFKTNCNEISFTIDKKIPKQLIGDKDKLSQIIINLLGNSLKFTKKGKVNLTVNLIEKEDDFSIIEFVVKDTGIGIAVENQTKIFDRFVQINNNKEDYQGTGLGLSIVKKLILLFDSEIHLKSEIDIGTTINFAIKFQNVNSDSSKIVATDFLDSEILNLKFLIVEDNKINQLVTKMILEKWHCNCTIIESGMEALEIVKHESFDLILMDINMPVMDGYKTAKKIRKLNIKTPIIALTAFSANEVKDAVLASGMNDFILKPFKSSELLQAISNQLQKTKNAD
jgi:signal transduction histidine kinase/CheY-like chemotaxis protein